MQNTLHSSNITSLPLLHSGKVRDIYDIDKHHLLIVTTDRLSAFDVILPSAIPQKGIILNQLTQFWLDKFSAIIPNQTSSLKLESVLTDKKEFAALKHHGMVVKKLKPLPIEAIVRGYIIGSGWKDYQATGKICDIALPANLKLADKLPQAVFTPSTKANVGAHDENISYQQSVDLLGADMAKQVREVSLKLYQQAADFALQRGIIIADTKFEFGLDEAGQLTLIDEVLTPDSSRFWSLDNYQAGISPESFDKQFVRDYLETLDWDKSSPAPTLPDEIVRKTSEKYQHAKQLLMG